MGNTENNHDPLPLMECELHPPEAPPIELDIFLRDGSIVISSTVEVDTVNNGFQRLKQLYDENVAIYLNITTIKKVHFDSPVSGAIKFDNKNNKNAYKYFINAAINTTIQVPFGLLLAYNHARIDIYFPDTWHSLVDPAKVRWTDTELIISYT